ncbi:MAG: hypothetical protein Q9M44_01715, partial [Ghiorsea sp.]|nr:hypothetical protein [Ghiorsea sp.]
MKKIITLALALTCSASISFANEDKIAELQAQLNALADYVEAQQVNAPSKTSIGGYGEMHYNNYANASNQLDIHRYILFVNH